MSQAEYVVENDTGLAVRQDINAILLAIRSSNSGGTQPSTMYAYQLWADTSSGNLKIRNGANNAWIEVGDLTTADLGHMLVSRFPNVNANITATDEELNLLDDCTATTTELNLLEDKTEANFITMKEVYPIGSIFTSVVATSPDVLLVGMSGTNWTAIGSGETLIGLDSTDSDFNALEKTGGFKTHQLSEDEMPIHKHGSNLRVGGGVLALVDTSLETTVASGDQLDHEYTHTTNSTDTSEAGGNIAHTIVQPYFVVYFWRRDAD